MSIIFGALSFLLIAITYFNPPENPHYAPHMFTYNFLFYFPMLTGSFIFGVLSFVYWVGSRKEKPWQGYKKVLYRYLIPIILLLPVTLHVSLLIYTIIRIKVEVNDSHKEGIKRTAPINNKIDWFV
jgi:hypothetical protein